MWLEVDVRTGRRSTGVGRLEVLFDIGEFEILEMQPGRIKKTLVNIVQTLT